MTNVKVWPRLFQKTNTGAIQQWDISVGWDIGESNPYGVIVVTFGQVDGKMQSASDTIREGKNPGKKNATTPVEQAIKEAESRWVKQKKKGYVEDIETARAGEVDNDLILGGIEPMLAPNKSFPKDDNLKKAIVFPCFWQPKLDGMRCIAIVENGVATVWSRTRRTIPTVPHIVKALGLCFPEGRVVLDGELYNHEYKDRFEDLMSILRGDEPDAEGEYLNAQFHIYDCPERYIRASQHTMQAAFRHRNMAIDKMFESIGSNPYIKRVLTLTSDSIEDLNENFLGAEAEGYEGGMARNANAPYEAGKRSKHLQKMKNFIDEEFPIEGVLDGRGKAEGIVIKFIVKLPNGNLAYPTYKATQAKRRELWLKPEMWKGKKLTVTFKRWTADGSLYLPVAKAIRDYE
jgi:DNA ligase-1